MDKEEALHVFREQMQFWQVEDTQIEQAFQYAVCNGHLQFEKLSTYLTMPTSFILTHLQDVYIFQVGEQFFLHCIYSDRVKEGERAFLTHSEQIFMQQPLHQIYAMYEWLTCYIELAQRSFSVNKVCEQLQLLMDHFLKRQPKSMQLKVFCMTEVLYRFTKGSKQYPYVLRRMAQLKLMWKRGKWALSVKERTLFAYIAMNIAYEKRQWKKVSDEANFLLKQDRIIDAAVEFIVEYGRFLQPVQPQPEALIKNYRTNVLENFFYMYIEALTKQKKYTLAFDILKNYEMATMTSLYRYLHEPSSENLIAIEAAFQKNIALLIDDSVSYIKQSLEKWYNEYTIRVDAFISSHYICYLLEILFVCEQYELFERLMEVYSKYMKFDAHYERLKQQVAVDLQQKQELLLQ